MSTAPATTEILLPPSREDDVLFQWQIRIARHADELVRINGLDTQDDRAVWLAAEDAVFNATPIPAGAASVVA